jgi:hypothetical protein
MGNTIRGTGVRNNFSATTNPTVINDSAEGYSVGSIWFNTVTDVEWLCYSNTAGTAVWTPTIPGGAGYISGKYYPLYSGSATTAAVTAADTLYLQPFRVLEKVTISNLLARTGTGGAGSSMKGGIWANSYTTTGKARPFGAPLAADNTGVATTGSSTNVELTISLTLYPNLIYWHGEKFSATLPTVVAIPTTSYFNATLIGTSSVGSSPIQALAIANTMATSLPTFNGSEVWSDEVGQVPIMRMKVA